MLDQILSYIPMAFQWASSQYPVVSSILGVMGSLVVLATVYVKLTPSQKDDAALAELESKPVLKKLEDMLVSFSLISKK